MGSLMVLGLSLFYVVVEWLKFLFLGGPGIFRVEIGDGITDQLLIVVALLAFHVVGVNTEPRLDVSFVDSLHVVAVVLIFDLFFGVHYLSHRNKTLWNLHRKHHMYKRDQVV